MTTNVRPSKKTFALDEIKRLAQENAIDLNEIAACLGKDEITRNTKSGVTLTRFFSVVGAIFLLAGIYGFVGMHWERMPGIWRIGAFLIPGGAAYYAMFAASRRPSGGGAYFNVFSCLSVLLQTAGLFVAALEASDGSHRELLACLLIFSTLCVQYAIAAAFLKRSAPVIFAFVFFIAAFASGLALVAVPAPLFFPPLGIMIVAISYALHRTPYASASSLGYVIGSIFILYMDESGFMRETDVPFTLAKSMALGSGLIYVSSVTRSKLMLFVASASLFKDVVIFTAIYFAHSIGWPLCLIALGLLFMAFGKLFLTIGRRYDKK
ncbi:MAG: DUF2157 domain-containing protein [Rickettsiales bacterium]